MNLEDFEFISAIGNLSEKMNVIFLRSMMDAGVFDFSDEVEFDSSEETYSMGKTSHGNHVVDALIDVLLNTHHKEVQAPGVRRDRFNGRDDWMDIWCIDPTEEFRAFHEDLCFRLTDQASFLFPEGVNHSDEELSRKNGLRAVSTLGGLLCVACAMGNDRSVRKITNAFPSTKSVAISVNAIGRSAWDWFKDPGKQHAPMVNPYFFAMQFSSLECMDAMEEAGHDSTGKSGFGLGSFNLPALLRAGSPACRPDVFLRVLRDHMQKGEPSTRMQREMALYDISKKMAEGFTNRRKSVWEIKAGRYHWAFVESNVFSLKANESAIFACAEGLPDLLESLFPALSWENFFRPGAPWPFLKATQYGQNFNFEDVQSVMIMFLNEAKSKGWLDKMLPLEVRRVSEYGEPDSYDVFPINAIICAGMDRVLRYFIVHGFDPNARLHPEAQTAMEYADRKNSKVAFNLRTKERHQIANDLLDELGP